MKKFKTILLSCFTSLTLCSGVLAGKIEPIGDLLLVNPEHIKFLVCYNKSFIKLTKQAHFNHLGKKANYKSPMRAQLLSTIMYNINKLIFETDNLIFDANSKFDWPTENNIIPTNCISINQETITNCKNSGFSIKNHIPKPDNLIFVANNKLNWPTGNNIIPPNCISINRETIVNWTDSSVSIKDHYAEYGKSFSLTRNIIILCQNIKLLRNFLNTNYNLSENYSLKITDIFKAIVRYLLTLNINFKYVGILKECNTIKDSAESNIRKCTNALQIIESIELSKKCLK